jgi:phage repressor protein C with HTH and peptisase S24 domain
MLSGAMSIVDQRAALERLILARGEDYAALSKLIGRNPAYIHQFIKRGSPKRLSEQDRRTLARYFGVGEQLLGGPTDQDAGVDHAEFVPVPRLDLGASAGAGAHHDLEKADSPICFDRAWLRRLCSARPEDLSIIRVEGDSMSPTLVDGDEIMVNAADGAGRIRDGVYVLRQEEALLVKRVAVNPATRRVTVKSDNIAYPLWPECKLGDLTVIGRVVWTSHKMT